MEQAIATLRTLSAVVIDPIKYPDLVIQARTGIYNLILSAEFKAQIADYMTP